MTQPPKNFAPFVERMQHEGLPDIVVNTFAHYYQQLAKGQTGLIAESDLQPVEQLPNAEKFPTSLKAAGQAALPKTLYLKLNGGLGTSMGLEQAKSLLPVKDGLTFLDIIARHALATEVRLLLMNSFATRADSLAVLEKYPELGGDIPLDFLQHKIPKINQADLSPASWPQEPDLEWCPPGHGDIYNALVTSGMLDILLKAGYEYAFISNADNLGAIIDLAILGYFASQRIPFMMEVTDRTEADSKGGHLAQLPGGQLILREIAQCPEADLGAFQDITRHKYFNTNNLWLHLPQLKERLLAENYILGLPMIRNAKTVDPRDKTSPRVYQLETAMGSAIGVFAGAQAIRVPRTRFAPVKKTNDLLVLRSDVFTFDDPLYGVVPHPSRAANLPLVELDPTFYGLIADFEARFPVGSPSLIACERLTIKGDFKFGRNITIKGNVQLVNESAAPRPIADETVLEDN